MGKRKKKKEPIKAQNSLIQDTSADPILLDVNAKDENVNNDGIIENRLKNHRGSNTIVFSMRMDQDLLNHIKQIARKQSVKERIDVPYQMLISEAVLEKYPMPKEKK